MRGKSLPEANFAMRRNSLRSLTPYKTITVYVVLIETGFAYQLADAIVFKPPLGSVFVGEADEMVR